MDDRGVPLLELAGTFDDADGLITSIAYTDDGGAMAVCSEDDCVRIYNTLSARQLSCLSATYVFFHTGVSRVNFVGSHSTLPADTLLLCPRHESDRHCYSFSMERGEAIGSYHHHHHLPSGIGSSSSSSAVPTPTIPVQVKSLFSITGASPNDSNRATEGQSSTCSALLQAKASAECLPFTDVRHIPSGNGFATCCEGLLSLWHPSQMKKPLFVIGGTKGRMMSSGTDGTGGSTDTCSGGEFFHKCCFSPSDPHRLIAGSNRGILSLDLRKISSSSASTDGQRHTQQSAVVWELPMRSLFTSLSTGAGGGQGSAGAGAGQQRCVPFCSASVPVLGCLDVHPQCCDKVLCTQSTTSEVAVADATAIGGSAGGESPGSNGSQPRVYCLSKDAAHTQKGQFGEASKPIPFVPEIDESMSNLSSSPGTATGTAGSGSASSTTGTAGAGGVSGPTGAGTGSRRAKKLVSLHLRGWEAPRQRLCCEAKYLSGTGDFIVQGTYRQRLFLFDGRPGRNYSLLQAVRSPHHIRSIPTIQCNPTMAMFASGCTKLHLWSSASEDQLRQQAREDRE